ncbi:hypothetical protein AX16_001682 [Volvariella volvacea WC 439]|nr:hypothetical protein AX16_001682 [Volvariella volvacea WC 439]
MAAVPQPLSLLPPSFTTKIKSPPQESIRRWEGQYQRVKNAEIDILQGSGPHTSDNLVAITILGCCMLETESLSGLLKLSDKIQAASHSSDGDEKLIELGKFYLRHLLKLFFRAQRLTPAPSEPEPDYPDEPQCHADHLSYIGAKHLAWTRDQRRCLVTGSYDDSDSSRQALEYHSRTHQFTYKLRTTYIITESFSNILEGSSDDLEALYMVLETFGFEDIIEDLRGPNIHRVCNILTLAEHVYTKFDWLAL